MTGEARFWTVRGLKTHARVLGQGRPLVVVPGLGCASWMYLRLGRELARERQVFLYDPPGHGASQGWPGHPRRIEELTEHLAAWLRVAGLEGAAVLGHSLGGEVMFDLAARFPELPGALIACAPTGIPENPSVRVQLLRLMLDLPRERPGLLWPGLRAYTRAGAVRMLGLARDQTRHDTGPLLPLVKAPTLLIDGESDPVIQSWTVQAIRAAIPGAVVREVPGGTHAVTDSHPATVARYTLDFLKRVED